MRFFAWLVLVALLARCFGIGVDLHRGKKADEFCDVPVLDHPWAELTGQQGGRHRPAAVAMGGAMGARGDRLLRLSIWGNEFFW